MIRSGVLGIALAAAGCYGDGAGFTLYVSDVPATCPTFDECPLALGGTAHVDVALWISDTEVLDDRFVAIVDDPAVVGVARVPYGLELTGLAEGSSTLRLDHLDDPIAISVTVHVAAVARTVIVPDVVRYGIAVTDSLAVLHDSRVILEARHFDAANVPLAGRGLDAWALRGAPAATLVGDAGATTHELGTRDPESFVVETGAAELAISVVEPSAVSRLELVNTDGRSPAAHAGEVVRVRERYNATFHVAGYDAAGAYIAGGGLPEDFSVSGAGVRLVDRVTRRVSLEVADTDLLIQLGAAEGTFGVVFP